MKGIILAGGLGTRLSPLTRITNKHLLPIYKKPMIYYPIEMLIRAGICEIMIVTGGHHAGEFLRLIGNGKQFGDPHIHYTYQEGEGGIAEALGLTEDFVDGDKVVVVLGDNILEKGISQAVNAFARQEQGARVLLTEVENPSEYGIAELNGGSKITQIIEKPKDPPSNLAVVGVYMYPPDVFEIIKTLEPSARGELEITDVNNSYLQRGELEYDQVDGFWIDAGESHEALLKANITMAQFEGAEIV